MWISGAERRLPRATQRTSAPLLSSAVSKRAFCPCEGTVRSEIGMGVGDTASRDGLPDMVVVAGMRPDTIRVQEGLRPSCGSFPHRDELGHRMGALANVSLVPLHSNLQISGSIAPWPYPDKLYST